MKENIYEKVLNMENWLNESLRYWQEQERLANAELLKAERLAKDELLLKAEKGEITWKKIPKEFQEDPSFVKSILIFNFRFFGELPAQKAIESDYINAAIVGTRIYFDDVLQGVKEGKIDMGENFDKEIFRENLTDFIKDKVRNSKIDLGIPVDEGTCIEIEHFKK